MPPADDSSPASETGDAIKVFVRVRPPAPESEHEARCLEVDQRRRAIILQSKPEPKVFTFDHVADINTQQETVFACVGKKMIECCVGGYNGTIFAYGQTGSGKTFTMLGPSEDQENFHHELRGVIPRSFEYLFSIINRQKELHGDKIQFLVKCSFIEIYNEQVFDLLDPACKGLQLRENIKKGVFVEGIIEQSVVSAVEAYEVLSSGWMNRTVAATSMNRESSRSHAVFTVTIESKENVNGVWNLRSGQLHLVDLAGSERQKDTHTLGIRLKEAGAINKSLSVLGNVIMALVDIAHGKQRFVPYRDSKLSFLLRDSLGGNSKTCIIANVHPGTKCCGETLSTLQFVRRAKMIKNKAVKNENAQGSLTALQAEIQRLKDLLAQYEQGTSIPVNPTPTGSGGNQSARATGNDSEWRQHFLTAMTFRQHAIIDFNKAQDAVKRMNQVLKRKEEALSQTKMILKFRQEALGKLQKAQKGQGEEDEKDKVIALQREEIKALEISAESKPDLAKCNAEKANLKADLDALIQRTKASSITDAKQAEKLDEIYAELVAKKKKVPTATLR